MTSDNASLVTWALHYAAQGLPVFPCHPRNKSPLCQHGCKDASTDPDVIKAWWQRWPRAMIGCATGSNGAGLIVDIDAGTDADTGEVFDPEGILKSLDAELGEVLPDTLAVRTPRGGLHLHLALPEGVECPNRAHLIPRVDIRGEGGYVILPPSQRSDGTPYAWLDGTGEHVRALAPKSLIDCVLRRGRWSRTDLARETNAQTSSIPSASGHSRYASAALRQEADRVAAASRGARNHALNGAAFCLGQLVAAGALREADVVAALEQAANACGLTQDDGVASVRKTVASGLKAGRALPRQLPAGGHHPRSSAAISEPLAAHPLAESEDARLDRELAEIDCTDRGNAERFRRRNSDRFRFSKSTGWLAWNGTHWTSDAGEQAVRRAVHETVDALKREADVARDFD